MSAEPDPRSRPRSDSRSDATGERALQLIRAHERFLLAGHVRPDGDCLGAQAGLARVLQSLGKRVTVLNPDPPAEQFSMLHHAVDFQSFAGGPIPEHDVCVLLDINVLDRCGGLAAPLRAAPSLKLVIDHHPFLGDPWWDAAFLDVSASATGVLVRRLALALGVPLDKPMALALFLSLVTDTGWFRYSNTDPETLSIASELIACGVRPAELFGELYQRNPMGEPRALGRLLERVEYHADGRLAVVDQPLGVESPVDSDAVLDIVRAVGAVEVVLFVKELEGGQCKLSARSKTDYDVNALARRFGGGGHRKASGATIQGRLAQVKPALVEAALADLHATADQGSKG